MTAKFHPCATLAAAVVSALGAQGALAQFVSGFESPPYVASASGVVLTGQDGWTASGTGFSAYTFAGNSIGITPSPGGGAQFIAGTGAGPTSLHDVSFAAGGSWTMSWDINNNFVGTSATSTTLGGPGTIGGGNRGPSTRNLWTDSTATAWNAGFFYRDAADTALGPVSPDPAFMNLPRAHWFRQSMSWSFDTNRITSVSITDLATGSTTTVHPTGWYLRGGSSSTFAFATQVRLLGGGTGSVVAIDNLNIAPSPPCRADFNHDGMASIQDLFEFLQAWFAADPRASINHGGPPTQQDIFDFLGLWFAGCP